MNSHKNAIKNEHTGLYNHRTDIVPPNCPIRTKFVFDGVLIGCIFCSDKRTNPCPQVI